MSRLLAEAAAIHNWLTNDTDTPEAERVQRDRKIGASLAAAKESDRVLAWWRTIEPESLPSVQRAASLTSWFNAGLLAFGLFLGASAAGVALAYDGDYPVNLLALLGVFVLLPGLLLGVSVLMCAVRGLGWVRFADGLGVLNINRLLIGVWQRFALLPSRLPGNRWGTVVHWQLVNFSQWFAVGFLTGAAGCLLLLVAVTDLAFGWSTTLNLDAAWVWHLTQAVAWPWSNLYAAAVPDLTLVEASRFYRLDGNPGELDAAALGAWWPFVLLALLVWGLLPRVLFLVLGSWFQRQAEWALLREHAEVSALLRRLEMPDVAYAARADDADPDDNAAPAPAAVLQAAVGQALVWDDAIADEALLHVTSAMDGRARRAAIAGIAAADVVVYAKGYEPPMLVFHDFMRDLREALGATASIVVLPRAVDGGEAAPADLEIWRQSLADLRDGRLFVSATA